MRNSLIVVFSIICSLVLAKQSVEFVNASPVIANLYWQSSEAQVRMAEIEPGKSYRLETYPGHIFVVKDASTMDQLGAFLVDEKSEKFTIEKNGDSCTDERAQQAINDLVRQRTAQERAESDRANNERRRMYLNREQPAKVPKFTPIGYEKRQIPSPVWEDIVQFWESHKNAQELERWDPGNSYVNHWESPPYMVQLPWDLRNKIFQATKPILEEWSGQALESTSCYGIRVYKNDSYLRKHVDVLQTHAVSAILQISQDVDEPWLLQIQNHAGEEEELELAPRDMVLYESAACIHGRETPMRGRYYANIFVHFRPRDNWNFPANYI